MKKFINLLSFILISSIFMSSNVYAQAAAQPTGGFVSLMPLIFILFFGYFFLIRPSAKMRKEHQAKLNALKKGDEIITSGGIYGSIVSIKENTVEIKIANDVNIKIAKQSISDIVTKKEDETDVKIPDIIK